MLAMHRYYGMKQQLLESFGFTTDERFPVYADRFPIQLLSYLRLSRIQDPGLFAKVRTICEKQQHNNSLGR
jgi:hypothetical protein